MRPNLFYSAEELLQLGFKSVGKNTLVSRDARFFSISGELGDEVRIDVFAVLTGNIFLEKGVHISPFSFLGGSGGEIRMNAHSGISTHVRIFTKSDDYTQSGDLKKMIGNVSIGRQSILGSGVTILPGVSIGERVRISSGCVIDRNIDSDSNIIHRGLGLVPFRSI